MVHIISGIQIIIILLSAVYVALQLFNWRNYDEIKPVLTFLAGLLLAMSFFISMFHLVASSYGLAIGYLIVAGIWIMNVILNQK